MYCSKFFLGELQLGRKMVYYIDRLLFYALLTGLIVCVSNHCVLYYICNCILATAVTNCILLQVTHHKDSIAIVYCSYASVS